MHFQIESFKHYDRIRLDSVDSTSQFLKRYLNDHAIDRPLVCQTHCQTAGYGQQGRRWQTNRESAIFSIAFPVQYKVLLSPSMSLNVAMALHQSLSNLVDSTLWLKWPNDLYDSEGKISGLLIEQWINSVDRCLIVGIGINRHAIDVKTSGYQASAVPHFSLHSLLESLVPEIDSLALSSELNNSQRTYWLNHDLFEVNESVWLESKEGQKSAHYLGIDGDGHLRVEVQGQVTHLSSGLNSVRKR